MPVVPRTIPFGEVLLTPLSLDAHYHVRDVSDLMGSMVVAQEHAGWMTLRAHFTARVGDIGSKGALERFLGQLSTAARENPQINVEISPTSFHAVTVRLSATFEQGAFPVGGLIEALTGPPQPRALPAPKQSPGMARWKG